MSLTGIDQGSQETKEQSDEKLSHFKSENSRLNDGGMVRSYLFKAMKTTEPNPACRLTSTKFIMYVHNSFLG